MRLNTDEYQAFVDSLMRTFSPLGGTPTEYFEETATQRISFGRGAYLDVSYGPGGNPIVGRGSGMMVLPRLTPEYDESLGITKAPTVTSGWDILGQITGEAMRNASDSPDFAQTFGNTINLRLGTHRTTQSPDELRNDYSFGAYYMPEGWSEGRLPEGALRRLGATYAAESVPTGAFNQVYGGYVPMGTPSGELMPVARYSDIQRAYIPGLAGPTSFRKAAGVQPYEQVQIGRSPVQDIPMGSGGTMRGQIHNVIMPLSGAISPAEGMAGIAPRLQAYRSRENVMPLPGWDTNRLGQIGSLYEGQALHGSEVALIRNQAGESMLDWRSPHWERANTSGMRISLPKEYGESTWYQGLSEQQRGMFDLSGGVVYAGQRVPALMFNTLEQRQAAGTVSLKGAGHKAQGYELDIMKAVGGNISQEELARSEILYEEAPKEWLTTLSTIGAAHGLLDSGEQLFTNGQINQPLVDKIQAVIAQNTRELTRTYEVTPGLAAPFLTGKVPGVSTQWLESGNLQVTQKFLGYVGPKANLVREEYPHAGANIPAEELRHIQATDPAYYERIMQVGQLPDAHIGVTRAYWASLGRLDPEKGAVNLSDIRADIAGIAAGGGNLVQAMAGSKFAGQQIIADQGVVLPSARHMMAMYTENRQGEQVSRLVRAWESALGAGNVAGYMQAAGREISSEGWIRTLQSVRMPGVMSPGVGRGDIPVGEIHLGENQFRQLVRGVVGHNPSDAELAEFRELMTQNDVVGKMTRFPQSDVYGQNELFLTARLSGNVGKDEAAMNPLVAASMRGDFDSDLYRWFTTSFQRDEQGKWTVANLHQPRNELQTLQSLVSMLESSSPEAVEQARRGLNMDELFGGYEGEQRQTLELSALVAQANYYANEQYKHAEKMGENSLLAAVAGAEDPQAAIAQYIGQQVQSAVGKGTESRFLEKELATIDSKGYMGRVYNAMIRSVGQRSRELDPELTRAVFGAAANAYQPTLDISPYNAAMPLGQRQGKDANISFGLARMMEAFSSASFIGGGATKSITGANDLVLQKNKHWERDEQGRWVCSESIGFSPKWTEASLDPAANIAGHLANIGVYMGEATPEQMSVMLTGRKDDKLAKAIQRARASIQEGVSAEDQASSMAGHLTNIMKLAGIDDARGLFTSTAPLTQSLVDTSLIRAATMHERALTGSDEEYTASVEPKWNALAEMYQRATRQDIATGVAQARKRQAGIDILSGETGNIRGDVAAEIGQYLPPHVTEGLREPTRSADSLKRAIPASMLGSSLEQMLNSLMEKELGIGGSAEAEAGTAIHGRMEGLAKQLGMEGERWVEGRVGEASVRGRLDKYVSQKEWEGLSDAQRQRLSAIGVGPNTLIDYKSGSHYSEEQLQMYGHLTERGGDPVDRLFYSLGVNPREGEDWIAALEQSKMVGVPTISGEQAEAIANAADARLEQARALLPKALQYADREALANMSYPERLKEMGNLIEMAQLEMTATPQRRAAPSLGTQQPSEPQFDDYWQSAPPPDLPAGRSGQRTTGGTGQPPRQPPSPGGATAAPAQPGGQRGGQGWQKQSPWYSFQQALMNMMGIEDTAYVPPAKYLRTLQAMMGGDMSGMEGEEGARLFSQHPYEYQRLVDVQKWLEKGAPADMPGNVLKAYRDAQRSTGKGGADYTPTLEAFEGLVSGQISVKDIFKDFVDAMPKMTEEVRAATKNLKEFNETGGMSRQEREYGRDVLQRQLKSAYDKAVREGGAEFLTSPEGRAAAAMIGGPGGPGSGALGAITEAGGAVLQKATSGFGLFTMGRIWNMLGAPAFRAENVAMQEEMATQQALASWGGGAQIGDMSRGLLGIKAQSQLAQTNMGRAAWMGYGPIQEALAGGVAGEALGVLGPAAAVGGIAGYLGAAAGVPWVGWAAGIGTAAFAGYNYLNNIGSDETELAYRGTGNFWDRLVATAGMLVDDPTANIFELMKRGQGLSVRGTHIRAGNLGLLNTSDKAKALQHWAGQAVEGGSFLTTDALIQQAGQWQTLVGDVDNTSQLNVGLFEQMTLRGLNAQQMMPLAMMFGGSGQQYQDLYQSLVNTPNVASTQRMLGRMSSMLQGDRNLWSRYAAGSLQGLPQEFLDIIGPAQSWMMTTDPATGLPLHTATGALYGGSYGALSTVAAQQGGQRGIQWAQMQSQFDYSRWQEQQQVAQYQLGYAYTTGAQSGAFGTQNIPPALANLIAATGGQWGLQDTQRAMAHNWQMYQFGYQQTMTDTRERHWQEDWQAQWGRFQTQKSWEDEQTGRQRERNAAEDEWWLYRWNYQRDTAALNYGWQMEDLDESIRFATGRQKLHLQKQKERATIEYGRGQTYSDEEREYWERMKEMRDEDLEKAEDHREEMNKWREEDLLRSKRQHEEIRDLEQGNFDKSKQHYLEQRALQEQQVQLEREYWKAQQEFQAESIKKGQEYNELQRLLREDQWKLTQDAQDAIARFQKVFSELDGNVSSMEKSLSEFNSEVERFNKLSGSSSWTGGESSPTGKTSDAWARRDGGVMRYHDGGPVGLMATTREAPAILQEGEYVVPAGGMLVSRDERVVTLLTELVQLTRDGNGKFTIMVQNPGKAVEKVGSVYDAAFAA